ncbi:putative ATP-dependent dna helicase q1 [Colletotrichum asianum]
MNALGLGINILDREVVLAITSGHMLIVQVIGIGGSKSVLFMLLVFCLLDGVMVVVMLLVALWMDLHRRCVKAASIIFVTPKLAVIKGFRDFIALDRVVVDECYVVLEGLWSFWPRLRELREAIREFGVQMIYLMATLALIDEAAFFYAMRSKVVIYAMSIKQVERLGLALRCAIFFSNVDLIEGKAA